MDVDYSGHADPVGSDALVELSKLGAALEGAVIVVKAAELELAAALKRVQDLTEKQIPELMDQVGMARFTTREGVLIKLEESVHGYISKDRAAEAYLWLEKNGHGQIIKRNVVVEFGVKQEEAAAELVKSIKDTYPGVQQKKAVHHMTLGAWAREQLENGADIPMELLGIHTRRVAKIG